MVFQKCKTVSELELNFFVGLFYLPLADTGFSPDRAAVLITRRPAAGTGSEDAEHSVPRIDEVPAESEDGASKASAAVLAARRRRRVRSNLSDSTSASSQRGVDHIRGANSSSSILQSVSESAELGSHAGDNSSPALLANGHTEDKSARLPSVSSAFSARSSFSSQHGGSASAGAGAAADGDSAAGKEDGGSEDMKSLTPRERAKRKVAEFRRQMEEKARAQLSGGSARSSISGPSGAGTNASDATASEAPKRSNISEI